MHYFPVRLFCSAASSNNNGLLQKYMASKAHSLKAPLKKQSALCFKNWVLQSEGLCLDYIFRSSLQLGKPLIAMTFEHPAQFKYFLYLAKTSRNWLCIFRKGTLASFVYLRQIHFYSQFLVLSLPRIFQFGVFKLHISNLINCLWKDRFKNRLSQYYPIDIFKSESAA